MQAYTQNPESQHVAVAEHFAKVRRLLLRRRRLLRFLGPTVGPVREHQRIAACRLERVDAELAELLGFETPNA